MESLVWRARSGRSLPGVADVPICAHGLCSRTRRLAIPAIRRMLGIIAGPQFRKCPREGSYICGEEGRPRPAMRLKAGVPADTTWRGNRDTA